jgi:hypothetical protein
VTFGLSYIFLLGFQGFDIVFSQTFGLVRNLKEYMNRIKQQFVCKVENLKNTSMKNARKAINRTNYYNGIKKKKLKKKKKKEPTISRHQRTH